MENIILILLGLCFGSFINAFVWRLHQQSLMASKRAAPLKELSIMKGRSMCPDCKHTLSATDLLPVVSWIALRGKCRYCGKPISWQYPLVEFLTALSFIFSYAFWPEVLSGLELVKFALWLVILVGLIALFVYDLKWMLLPNRIIFPLYGVVAIFVIITAIDSAEPLKILLAAIGGVAIGGGIFYLLFQISNGKWIGGGDVKLGFLLGALLGDPLLAGFMLFLASVLGTAVAIPMLVKKKDAMGRRIPFGPFLILSAIILVMFGKPLAEWYASGLLMY